MFTETRHESIKDKVYFSIWNIPHSQTYFNYMKRSANDGHLTFAIKMNLVLGIFFLSLYLTEKVYFQHLTIVDNIDVKRAYSS